MTLDPQTTAWLDQEDAHLATVIRCHRWAVQYVGSGEQPDEPCFGYSVGLFGVGHPELVMVGLGPEDTHGLLGEVAAMVADGRNLVSGEFVTWDGWAGRRASKRARTRERSSSPRTASTGGRPTTRCPRTS